MSTLRGHKAIVKCVTFSPDGRRIASGSEDGTVRIWATHIGKAQWTLRGHKSPVTSVAFSRDGRRIVSGYSDGSVRIWNVEGGFLLRTFRLHETSDLWKRIHSVEFSPDGGRVVSGADKTVHVWDTDSGQELLVLHGHKQPVKKVTFTSKGRAIVSHDFLSDGNNAGDAATVRIWDAKSGECREVISGWGDVAAIAKNCQQLPLRVLARGLETVVEIAANGVLVAVFPVGLSNLCTNSSGCQWAGVANRHLHILQLEGSFLGKLDPADRTRIS